MAKLFLGGMPTDIDVRKLVERFGEPAIGVEIEHHEVEDCLGLNRKSARFRSVTLAWRRRLLKDHNIHLAAQPSVGFRSLDPAERISTALAGVQSGVRKQVRAVRGSDRVNTEDPVLLKKQALLHRYGIALATEASVMMRQIEPPKPPQQAPQRPALGA